MVRPGEGKDVVEANESSFTLRFEQWGVRYCSTNKGAFFIIVVCTTVGFMQRHSNFVGGILFSGQIWKLRHLDCRALFVLPSDPRLTMERDGHRTRHECVYVTPFPCLSIPFSLRNSLQGKPRYRWVSVWKHDFLSPWKKNISSSDRPRFLSFLFFSVSFSSFFPFFNNISQNART